MKKAFSLIELLISLIVVSVIIASFTPILTTKLKHRELAISTNKAGKKCSEKFGENCVYCSETECSLCLNFLSCASNQYIDVSDNCQCKNCTFLNCASCTKDYCTGCKEGYGYNSADHTCSICLAPNVSDGGKNTCRKCDSGYEYQDENGKRYCKTCDSANGYFPDADRKGCTQKTCNQGYRREGNNCIPCSGTTSYQPYNGYSGTTCYTCGTNEIANSSHTGCDSTCVSASSCQSNQALLDGCHCSTCGANTTPNASKTACDSLPPVVPETPPAASPICPEHCLQCSSETSCDKCEDGYEWKNGACNKKIPCNLQMVSVGAQMVTRFNMGDDPNCNRDDLSKLDSEIIFVQAGTASANRCDSSSKKCCWYGNTASPCGDASGGIYGGCNRTVCNHAAAQALCKAVNMSLPTSSQMSGWNGYSTKNTGLMLCHTNQSGNTNLSNCNGVERCKNTGTGNCYPGHVWSSSSTSAYHTEGAWNEADKTTKEWVLGTTNAIRALSVRCIQ